MNWELLINNKLCEMDSFLKDNKWFGRENEIVNLFTHNFLLKECDQYDFFTSPCQIGIEVSVKQLKGINRKELVRKDLVIWPKGISTVWDQNGNIKNNPVVIIEWKVESTQRMKTDINWLIDYTTTYPEILGYSVCAIVKANKGLIVCKVSTGLVEKIKVEQIHALDAK